VLNWVLLFGLGDRNVGTKKLDLQDYADLIQALATKVQALRRFL
jgi:hypothetical protein